MPATNAVSERSASALRRLKKLLEINDDPVSPKQSDAPTYTQRKA